MGPPCGLSLSFPRPIHNSARTLACNKTAPYRPTCSVVQHIGLCIVARYHPRYHRIIVPHTMPSPASPGMTPKRHYCTLVGAIYRRAISSKRPTMIATLIPISAFDFYAQLVFFIVACCRLGCLDRRLRPLFRRALYPWYKALMS